ncbi:MAG: ferrous iron transport protein A [Planctomycetota bacterium]
MPLSTIGKGASATLHAMELDAEDAAYMAALGLTDGCPLRVCRPGEPCIVQVRTTRIGLSACVARKLLVVPITDRGLTEEPLSAPDVA